MPTPSTAFWSRSAPRHSRSRRNAWSSIRSLVRARCSGLGATGQVAICLSLTHSPFSGTISNMSGPTHFAVSGPRSDRPSESGVPLRRRTGQHLAGRVLGRHVLDPTPDRVGVTDRRDRGRLLPHAARVGAPGPTVPGPDPAGPRRRALGRGITTQHGRLPPTHHRPPTTLGQQLSRTSDPHGKVEPRMARQGCESDWWPALRSPPQICDQLGSEMARNTVDSQ